MFLNSQFIIQDMVMEMHTKEKIVVVGGCGHVGRTICGILGECYPGKVYASGRSRERAERCFEITRNGEQEEALSFTDGQTFDFGTDLGRRQACRFPFSGQMTLPRTLEVPSAATCLCLDSAMVTGLLAGASRTGAVRLLQAGRLRRRIVRSLGALRFGEDRFAVRAEARGRSRDGKLTLAECFLHGRVQSAATAKVAAASAAMLVDSFCPSGVYHIEQLTGMGSRLKELGPDMTCYIRRSDLPPEGREAS
ncbi:hypothetical protein NDS46_15800 [Paenibacillus thiaminolyticus]|uniref:hypothetical protein n=1 Tax=Paenibacillus thiaminolyticus TaxID=49283 RepID=UPI00232B8287|nr:hypothetical protein [Paenibacillus thiaminolyticus]WCF11202.1 hypothetical protein NDS46_15800 [Paenibacillus thiaminolyticus]